jgi:hypothetical protein
LINSALRPAILEDYILPLDVASLAQACVKTAQPVREQVGPFSAEKPNHRQCWRLRMRSKRPHGGRTSNQLDELAPIHCRPKASRSSIVTRQTSRLEGLEATPADVRLGSEADIRAAKSHVRFTPESRH